jgi:uncharacterized damage-inducible protein DinB
MLSHTQIAININSKLVLVTSIIKTETYHRENCSVALKDHSHQKIPTEDLHQVKWHKNNEPLSEKNSIPSCFDELDRP